jgi:hypothetical protein
VSYSQRFPRYSYFTVQFQIVDKKEILRTIYNTYLCSWAFLEKLPIVQPLKNFPAFYWTRRYITVFTRPLHWSLFWARSIQSIPPHPISLRSILILATHLSLGLPSGLFFVLAFPPISYMHSSSPHSCYIPVNMTENVLGEVTFGYSVFSPVTDGGLWSLYV